MRWLSLATLLIRDLCRHSAGRIESRVTFLYSCVIAVGNLSTLGVLFSYTGFNLLWATCFLTGGLSWHESFCLTGRSLHLQHISKDGRLGRSRRPKEVITDSVSSDHFPTTVETPDVSDPSNIPDGSPFWRSATMGSRAAKGKETERSCRGFFQFALVRKKSTRS